MSEIRTDTINNASGDNDSGIDLSTNDQVVIKTANTTALTVDASQNVKVGGIETDQTGPLMVKTNSSNYAIYLEENSGQESWQIGTNSTGDLDFRNSGGTDPAIKFDDSGNLLVGTTNSIPGAGNTAVGASIYNDGRIFLSKSANTVVSFNRNTSDGSIAEFRKDGSTVGSIGNKGTELFIGTPSGSGGYIRLQSAGIVPATSTGTNSDGTMQLGTASGRFSNIYATNGTIQTSDQNEKQDIEELNEAEQRVAVVAKGLLRKYRWKDKVAEKGDNARTHFGIIAQDLQDAFTAESLDAGDYAMFCSDTWWEKEISVDAVEADEENGIEAKDAYTYIDTKDEATEGYTEKTRLGVRYNQLLAFIISAI
jgi:hypothetical protein